MVKEIRICKFLKVIKSARFGRQLFFHTCHQSASLETKKNLFDSLKERYEICLRQILSKHSQNCSQHHIFLYIKKFFYYNRWVNKHFKTQVYYLQQRPSMRHFHFLFCKKICTSLCLKAGRQVSLKYFSFWLTPDILIYYTVIE